MQQKQTNMASAGIRFIAALIDFVLGILVLIILVFWVSRASDIAPLFDSLLVSLIVLILSYVFWQVIDALLTAKLGGTIGKLVTGIKVVDGKGKLLSFRRALFRETVGKIASSTFFWLGFIWIVPDEENRAWHDMVSGSRVIKVGKYGYAFGILVFASLLLINVLLVSSAISNFRKNSHIYLNLVQDAAREIQRTINEVE